jgi:hypothetical protein
MLWCKPASDYRSRVLVSLAADRALCHQRGSCDRSRRPLRFLGSRSTCRNVTEEVAREVWRIQSNCYLSIECRTISNRTRIRTTMISANFTRSRLASSGLVSRVRASAQSVDSPGHRAEPATSLVPCRCSAACVLSQSLLIASPYSRWTRSVRSYFSSRLSRALLSHSVADALGNQTSF